MLSRWKFSTWCSNNGQNYWSECSRPTGLAGTWRIALINKEKGDTEFRLHTNRCVCLMQSKSSSEIDSLERSPGALSGAYPQDTSDSKQGNAWWVLLWRSTMQFIEPWHPATDLIYCRKCLQFLKMCISSRLIRKLTPCLELLVYLGDIEGLSDEMLEGRSRRTALRWKKNESSWSQKAYPFRRNSKRKFLQSMFHC